MRHFTVTVCTATGRISYDAIAAHSFDLHDAAVDLFGVCAISVRAKHV